jgi:release factor glutamine methyltransferase
VTAGAAAVPLLVHLELTDDQQRRIREETGLSIRSVPFESTARTIRVTFGGITLNVPRGVFVPAAASERTLSVAVSVAAEWPAPIVVDAGTGCGAVALSLAKSLPSASIYGTDISEAAVRAARKNRARLGLRNARFMLGSLLSPLPKKLLGRVSVVVANAPYVPPRLTDAFAGAVPADTAIGVGADGLGLVREIAVQARRFLVPGGSLVLQMADFQWPALSEELLSLGYREPKVLAAGQGPVVGQVRWNSR